LRVTSVTLPPTIPADAGELRVLVPEGALALPATVWVDVLSPAGRVARAWARVEAGTDSPTALRAQRPAVQRGDAVQLVAQVGGVTATTVGRALEAGRVGERVRVENIGSGRTVAGVLLDGGLVDVTR
ncbi:MAG: flagellar basal body P-ring formation protein FlgA, partial [Proteobacteria bacterium]|nr:flagellar basal body P-ring formation protein FlgA [Pseudomonadota bacterium]